MSERVVSPAWLARHLESVGATPAASTGVGEPVGSPTDGTVRVVDVRDAWEFEGIGHVPGAVNVPFDAFRADEHAAESALTDPQSDGLSSRRDAADERNGADESGMLPGVATFEDLMGEAGIDRETHIVAYDDHHGVFAARLLVTAELYGHPTDRLHLLDGDFSAWRLEYATSSEAPDRESRTYDVQKPAETPLVDADAVSTAMDDPETEIVDTREAWEFEESHIPGAVRLDWRELVDDQTRGLKPESDLRSILTDRGIVPGNRTLLYCNTARRISHTYVVLAHLGYPDLAFYEGSLTEWEAAGRPVESDE